MRVAVSHSLVLALVAGPLLCCCTAAHLAPVASAHPSPASVRVPSKSCCQESPKPADDRHPAPADHAPCPCKDAAATPALSEPATGGTDSFTPPPVGPAAFDAVPPVGLVKTAPAHSSCYFSALSAADLLFVHHNLRC